MKREFIEKVISERSVDTRKYRYVYRVGFDAAHIERIELSKLGTTAAYSGWELVKKIAI